MTMTSLAEATWPELESRPTVVVPLGSTEQHGPHLPLSTDTLIATAVAGALADCLKGYLAPSLEFGASGEHQDFPGTVSLGTNALKDVIVELTRSVSTWAGKILLVNGHGGNREAVADAVAQLLHEGHDVSSIPCSTPGDAHAGRSETSLMMHLAPNLVRVDNIAPGNSTPIEVLMPELVKRGVRDLSPNGILGDPSGASAEEGAVLFRQMVETARNGI